MAPPSHPYIALVRVACLIAAAALLIACPDAGKSESEGAVQVSQDAVLQRRGAKLQLVRDGLSATMQAGDYLPYRIVTHGSVSLVTTIGSDLVPITYSTDGTNVQRYADMLPLVVQPHVIALMGLPADVSGGATGTVLLGANGQAAWRHPHADLLWPETGDPGEFAYCLIPGKDSDPIAPYGIAPQVVCVTCPSGREVWRKAIPNPHEPVQDIALLALGSEHGLLLVQHGYDDYNLYKLRKSDGQLLPFHTWQGHPLRESVYPGPISRYAGLSLDGDQFAMQAYVEGRGWRRWQIDILSWERISDEPAEPSPQIVEENPHPLSGVGVPGPSATLFPQQVLPTAHGSEWSIPALLNARGDVLVIDADGARWLSPELSSSR